MKALEGKVAIVAGATRGCGRGIACALGEAGATVYCTGRSVRKKGKPQRRGKRNPFELSKRPETIEETAEMVTARGGRGLWAQVDHTVEEQVKKLIQRVRREQGKLHILVNDIWGGDLFIEFGQPFWKVNLKNGLPLLERSIFSHVITAHYAAPLLIDSGNGLIVEVTDGDTYYYRGNVYYDLVKTSVIRLAFAWARELKSRNIAAVAITPGFLRSEAMLEHFGVTEENWKEAVKKEPNYIASETPLFVGRAVAAIAADPDRLNKSGKVFSSWDLGDEYRFKDVDGRRPHWGKQMKKLFPKDKFKKCDEKFYEYWFGGPMDKMFPNWP